MTGNDVLQDLHLTAHLVQVSNCTDSSESLEKRQAGSITVTRMEPDTGAQRDRCLCELTTVIKNTKNSQQADTAHTDQRLNPVNDLHSGVSSISGNVGHRGVKGHSPMTQMRRSYLLRSIQRAAAASLFGPDQTQTHGRSG